ncbi:MAG: DNA-binding protein [Acidimicrobiales bacterium]|jgi:predicted DNA-binding transcriptional regulator AlpA
MTAGQVAQLLGVSRQRVHQLTEEDPTFPAPVAVLSIGRVWERADIEKWARATGRLE